MRGPTPTPAGRYSPAECTGIKKVRAEGDSDENHISTSFAEAQNKTMRMHMYRFTNACGLLSIPRQIESALMKTPFHITPSPIPAALLAAVSMAVALPVWAQTNPIPGIGIVVKKNPGGGSIANPPTGVDGNFEVKGLPMGLYDVLIGSCAPIPFVVGQDGT
jgi:hypothetical protein